MVQVLHETNEGNIKFSLVFFATLGNKPSQDLPQWKSEVGIFLQN